MDEHARPETPLDRLERRLLGGPRTLTLRDLAARLDVPEERVRAFWQAFGMPLDDEAAMFTEHDAEVLARLFAARDASTLRPHVASSLVRSVTHLTDRLAVWQIEALVEHLVDDGMDDAEARLALIERLVDAAPVLEEQLVHAWRHNLAGHARRLAAQVQEADDQPADRLPLARAVGFADVVSFTARTAGLDATSLADFVQDFDTKARDVVSRGGARTVKTIGDAVFFVADTPRIGAGVGLDLVEAFGAGPTPVRVGLVWGHVLGRFGDVYGPPVNVAARLTAEADPATVLTDEETAKLLADEPDLRLEPLPERELHGVGTVRPVRVRRA
ncbi:MAG: adenylate/guanylate cyclase domain-containing protein [Actinomycetales bacterium]|nr:adenylate/guanylate cyclase domain-containing protein [Actinomycetales bacterium]